MTMTPSCPHEAEVLDLVWTNQWPARADRSLVEHVAACEVCRDLATVASAVNDLHEATAADVKVPDASVVWYRAEVRARQELTRRATRPVAAAQIAAAVVGLGGVFTAWRLGGASLVEWWRGLSAPELPQLGVWSEVVSLASAPVWPWILAAAAAWALMVPAALYIARVADRTTEPTRDRS
jgi:hypothetical protein